LSQSIQPINVLPILANKLLLLLLLLLMHHSKDKPEDLGYPPVEPAAEKPKAAGEAKPKPNVLKQLLNNVLKNPFIWGMALTYFFIYIVRQVRTLAGKICSQAHV
jgi:sugar phosphate permease